MSGFLRNVEGSYLRRETIPMKSRTFWHPLIFYAPYLFSNNQGQDTANNSGHSNEVRSDGTACHVAIAAPARSVVSHLKRIDKVGPWDINTIHFLLKHFQYLENIVHLQSFTISNLSVFHGEDCVPFSACCRSINLDSQSATSKGCTWDKSARNECGKQSLPM